MQSDLSTSATTQLFGRGKSGFQCLQTNCALNQEDSAWSSFQQHCFIIISSSMAIQVLMLQMTALFPWWKRPMTGMDG
ncbi:unnamed protein product [Boreogadus saida]